MDGWSRIAGADGSRWLVFAPLAAEGLAHAFTLRPEASRATSSPASPESLAAAAGLPAGVIARPKQVHGRVVARPDGPGGATAPREADVVIVAGHAGLAAIATADCVPAILWAPASRSFAVIHAGWRGTIAGAVPAAIAALREACGEDPSGLRLAMGPSIGPCCYPVGEEVAGAFREAFPPRVHDALFGRAGGRTTIDLAAANRFLAVESGVPASRIDASGICTACRRDLCWSYRVEGPHAGRMWAIAGVAAEPLSPSSIPRA